MEVAEGAATGRWDPSNVLLLSSKTLCHATQKTVDNSSQRAKLKILVPVICSHEVGLHGARRVGSVGCVLQKLGCSPFSHFRDIKTDPRSIPSKERHN